MQPKQIVAVGDSAGGNLLCSLTTWCILNKVRKPDELLLFYPAMSTETNKFTPSLLFSLNDPMLNYSSLRMCSFYYNGDGQEPDRNPFISPRLLPPHILASFPSTTLYIGELDPLRDNVVRFANNLHRAGSRVKLHYLVNLQHGHLSSAYDGGLFEAIAMMDDVMKMLREILSRPFEAYRNR